METEIKIEVEDFDPVRARLREVGATFVGTSDEENVYLDRGRKLDRRQAMLRLRRDARVRLTWKGPTEFQNGVRSRPEIELEVSSFTDALDLLERLGFQPIEHLAKRRETWRLPGVEIALDTLAFGQFVELEGNDAAIRTAAAGLGLDLGAGLPQSYRELRHARESSER